MNEAELRTLSNNELVEIGCHTVTHPRLSSISPTEQRKEIGGSKQRLEEIVGVPVTSFSYPYGDAPHEAVEAARQEGFASACGTEPGLVRLGSNRLLLPRVWAKDLDGAAFERFIDSWFAH